MDNKFLTLSELSRETGYPASRIQAAVEAGLIHPAGRTGTHPNSPIIFIRDEVDQIKSTLAVGFRAYGSAAEPHKPHKCRSAAEVAAKAAAFDRARQEGAQ